MARSPRTPALVVRNVSQLGELCRAERKRKALTLDDVYASTGLTTRFLSEFERGKEHASISRALLALNSLGLDVIVVPRNRSASILRQLHDEEDDAPS